MLRRTRKRDDKPLSHETINKTLTRLGQVPGRPKRYGYIAQNPVHERGVKLKTRKPQRSYLDSGEQITALLEAAKGLDGKGAKVKPYRHAMVATLVFSGLRLGELLALRWRDVDLAEGWLHVKQEGDGKTEAATRRVKLRPVLREMLTERKAARNATSRHELVFPTRGGKQHSQSNIRTRVVTPAAARASKRLETPLPKLTPQSLRRTFASILYAIGEPPPVVMQEMGHADPKLALRVYAEAMRRDPEENQRLRALVDGNLGTDEVLVPKSPDIAPNPIGYEEGASVSNGSS